jgi:hypothetical protein
LQKKREERGLPDVFGEAVLDEVLVFVLVQPHEDGVVAGLGPRLEVEHHPGSRGRSPPERIEEGRESPGVRAAVKRPISGRLSGGVDEGRDSWGISLSRVGFVRVETKQSRGFLVLFYFSFPFCF